MSKPSFCASHGSRSVPSHAHSTVGLHFASMSRHSPMVLARPHVRSAKKQYCPAAHVFLSFAHGFGEPGSGVFPESTFGFSVPASGRNVQSYEHAYTHFPETGLSHWSEFTGVLPEVHGNVPAVGRSAYTGPTVAEVANAVGLSPTYFSRRYRQAYRCSEIKL